LIKLFLKVFLYNINKFKYKNISISLYIMSNGLQKEVESQAINDRFYRDAEFLRAYNKGIAHAMRIAELRADFEFPGPQHFPNGMTLMTGGGSSTNQGLNTNAEYTTLTVGGKVRSANERIIGGQVNRLKKATKYRDFVADTLDKGLDLATKGKKLYGGVNRLKKAVAYRDFAADTVDKGLDLATKGKKIYGGKVDRLHKAKKWTEFAAETLDSGLNLGLKAKSLAGSGKTKTKTKTSAWILHVKKYAADHKIPYKEAMSASRASYKK
jgi:hypothetical protein